LCAEWDGEGGGGNSDADGFGDIIGMKMGFWRPISLTS
jgi:hypothetical protein